jgi:hypothetical protein
MCVEDSVGREVENEHVCCAGQKHFLWEKGVRCHIKRIKGRRGVMGDFRG